ncbi:MAG: DNA mismatch repair protein MutL [Ignavibacteriaceae bacterium]|nr:DNA mismatch repair protein MutL [Ignavibacteriaceae bacterium]MCK6612775.1 DNA mismatch repair endonuclease MutL [Ignavibacteriaceae bacterium]
MSKITILPENLSKKIAAGEVVQRPESVVKELMENSIDAHASRIELLIKRAGKQLIQVIDDGEGMSEEDAILCIQKHATSKLKTENDLDAIKTLGFRGEALSAVSAVAQVEIKTQTAGDLIGTSLRIDEQGEIFLEKGSFARGTSISVKNLFYNVPARRNFLKTDTTELKHIVETFNRLALGYPEIHFKLYIDDDLALDFTPCTLAERMDQVFIDKVSDAVIPVKEVTDYITLTGYIGKPFLLKKNKGDQYLFLNRRFVISRQMNHAVFSAYENVMEKGEYPFFVLFLEVDYSKVDVNVHPSKLEIRFDNEKDIYTFILAVVRKSLSNFDLVPSAGFTKPLGETERIGIDNYIPVDKNDFSDRPAAPRQERDFSQPRQSSPLSEKEIDLLFGRIDKELESSPVRESFREIQQGINSPRPAEPVQRQSQGSGEKLSGGFIVQLSNKYILAQVKSGLMIIDQHAADERIRYEEALNLFKISSPFSQLLVFHKTLQMNPGDFALARELSGYLERLGFAIKFFSGNTAVIEGVPPVVKEGEEDKTLLNILAEYYRNQQEKKVLDVTDNLAKSYSCHTAIRTGDKLNESEMRALIDRLFATEMPYVCPHGRPIIMKISIEEFDRRFGRT